ncbi:MAG: helix-turn-helix transcriptional regulator [Armatimonadota bacterium]
MRIHPPGITIESEFELDYTDGHPQLVYFISGIGEGSTHITTHAHSYHEVFLLREGNCIQHAGSDTYYMGPDDLMIAKPGQSHEIIGNGSSKWRYFCLAFYTSTLPDIDQTFERSSISYITGCSDLIQICTKIQNESRQSQIGMTNMIQSLVTEFVIDIARRIGNSQKKQTLKSYTHEVVLARIYIERNSRHDLSINEIARAACVSPAHLAKRFKDEMHISLHKYVKQLLMQRSADLLENKELSISEIAEQLGFPSIHYFSSSFKNYWKKTPSQYRANRKM